MEGVSKESQVIAEAAFSRFFDWVSSQPNAVVLQAALQLLNDALDGQPVDRRLAREAAESLADVAQQGPYAEVMVQTFDYIRETLELDQSRKVEEG